VNRREKPLMGINQHQANDISPSRMRLAVIALEFGSSVLGGLLFGYYLGEYMHKPWIGLAGLLAGVFLGFFRLITEILRVMKVTPR
jgi:F0F1-type ATP synthase assembly protein I